MSPGLISVVVVTPDTERKKIAKVLMGEDEILVEEDAVVVVEGRKKQTLWLTGITTKNLPDQFSIFTRLHFLWSN